MSIGHKIVNDLFTFNGQISKKYERKGKNWFPEEPDFEELEGEWIIIEFNPLLFTNSKLGLVGEHGVSGIYITKSLDLRTLEYREYVEYNINTISEIHVLESPEVSAARSVVKEVEEEKLNKSLESGIAMYAHTILKLKERLTETTVSQLINILMDGLQTHEENVEEADILGEELAGGPSKTKQEIENFIEKHDSVKKWAEHLEKKSAQVESLSINQIFTEMEKLNEDNDDEEIQMYAEWIGILKTIRDPIVDEVIQNLYFEIKSIK